MMNESTFTARLPYGLARRLHIAALLLATGSVPISGQVAEQARETEEASAQTADACPVPAPLIGALSEPLATVRYLSDDSLNGRLAGSPGGLCAGEYLAARFHDLGLEPAGVGGTYFQDVPLASVTNPHAPAGTGRNVVARLNGADPGLEGEILIIGAHYDHLGMGGFGSMEEGVRAIHNGADDNASGVAALLEVARRLSEGPRPARSIVFIAFTGEESGLLGSNHWAKEPTVSTENATAMLNMDMVGRLESNPLIVYGMGTAEEWETIVEAANESVGLELAFESAGYGPSDHTSFYSRDIPVLHFFTNVHGDYHKPSDDWEKIDGEGLSRVADLVSRIAADVADRSAQVALIRGAGAPEQRAEGYGAWLGTVPDFTPVERGVLISGVGADSPAEKAGLLGGDIIVGLGEFEVEDLYGMTDALRALKPGDEVEVRVLRDDQEMAFKVVLGNRADRGS